MEGDPATGMPSGDMVTEILAIKGSADELLERLVSALTRPVPPTSQLSATETQTGTQAFAERGRHEVGSAEVSVGEALAGLESIEQVKRMLEAGQAVLTAHVVSVRIRERAAAKRSVRGVAAETARDVGLHRGLGQAKARRLVDTAVACPLQAPALFAAWVAGRVSEEKITTFFEETKLLTDAGRAAADESLSEVAGKVGAREWRERLQSTTARLEPERAAEKARAALETRHVQSKTQSDGLMKVTALLPGVAGQGVETTLSTYARQRKAAGDERTTGQIKADLLAGVVIAWARATGQTPPGFAETHRIKTHGAARKPNVIRSPGSAAEETLGDPVATAHEVETEKALEAFRAFLHQPDRSQGLAAGAESGGDQVGIPAGVGVQVNLVITDLSLFGITDSPAELFGLGSVPAELAREMIAHAASHHAATLKRLYTEPGSGALVKMESTSRAFPDGLAQMIFIRDGHCRFPFCDAPIRHLDHIRPHAAGGATSYSNGQGLCAAHNLVKDTNYAVTYPVPADTATGSGGIVTRLASGAEFRSPSRRFPHEDPTTTRDANFWAGFRAGRSVTDTELVQRSAQLDHRTRRLEQKKASLDRIRTSLTTKTKQLAVDRARLQRELLRVSCSKDFYDKENQRLTEAFATLKETRAKLEDMRGDVEITLAGLEDARIFADHSRAKLEQDRAALGATRTAFEQDRAELESARSGVEQDREHLATMQAEICRREGELDQAWTDLTWHIMGQIPPEDPFPAEDWTFVPMDPRFDESAVPA